MESKVSKTFLYMALISLLLIGVSVFLCIYSKWQIFAILSLVFSSGVSIYLFIQYIINLKKEKNG